VKKQSNTLGYISSLRDIYGLIKGYISSSRNEQIKKDELRYISSLKGITQMEWENVEDNGGDSSVINISQDNYYLLCDLYLEKLKLKHKIQIRAKKLKKYAMTVANLIKDSKNLENIMDYQEIMLEMPVKTSSSDIFPSLCKYYATYIPIDNISVEKYLNMYLEIPKK